MSSPDVKVVLEKMVNYLLATKPEEPIGYMIQFLESESKG